MRKILFDFSHGLGDAAQFTCVLQHMAKYRPDHEFHVMAGHGKHSCFHGLCAGVYTSHPGVGLFDDVSWVGWYENYSHNVGSPSTKVCNYLREEHGIAPDESLLRYKINVSPEARRIAAEYLEKIAGSPNEAGDFPVVVLHYEGNTSCDRKNLSHETASAVCEAILVHGYVPVVLDWDGRSPVPDWRRIHCPNVHERDIWGGFGSGDAGVLAALIEQSMLMIGVDSGPLHVAGATSTPTVGAWTGHHPLQFYDLCPNVVHLVPKNWRDMAPCAGDEERQAYFESRYQFDTYDDVTAKIVECVTRGLPRRNHPGHRGGGPTDLTLLGKFWVRIENSGQDMIIVKDVYYDDCYKTSLLVDRIRRARLIVDVGAHIGCFARKARDLNPNCVIACVEACVENIPALRANAAGCVVIEAPCTYEKGDLVLLNAYHPNCRSTGGSAVITNEEYSASPRNRDNSEYEPRTLKHRVTLEEIQRQVGIDGIDLLKLDCEGSEYSILENCDLSKVGFIVGEYHGRSRWDALVAKLVADGWDYGHMSEAGDLGNFHLKNPSYQERRVVI